MNKILSFIFLCLVASTATSLLAQESKVESKLPLSDDIVDQVCEIVLISDKPNMTQTYVGKVVELDDEQVVVTDVRRHVRVERGVPIFGKIPYLNRLFKNVGIGTEKVPGKLTIKRGDIHSVKLQQHPEK